MGTD
ncbi:hypothetical protein QTP70_021578 [Hemibagrus guttatus]|jgi:hypothetical protein